ncbi:MAG: hypothetical protein HYX97_05585 [Chloroflexi bacterium]|nr:hypothetical protein [Chloroflexota bacterium]
MTTAQRLFDYGMYWYRLQVYLNNPTLTWEQVLGAFKPLPLLKEVNTEKWEPIARELETLSNILSKAQRDGLDYDSLAIDMVKETLARCEGKAGEVFHDLVVLESKSKWRTDKLLGGASTLLADGDQALADDIERASFKDACTCLLSGAWTASEFSALRVAESVLRRWHANKTGKELSQTWGRVLGALEKAYPDETKRPKELAFLKYLKGRRDEINHPQRVSGLGDAEFTLEAVCRLIQDLKSEIKPATPLGTDSNAP